MYTLFYDLLCTEVLGKLKTGYLLVYNGIQWSCFILIVVALLKLLRGGLGESCCGVGSSTVHRLSCRRVGRSPLRIHHGVVQEVKYSGSELVCMFLNV